MSYLIVIHVYPTLDGFLDLLLYDWIVITLQVNKIQLTVQLLGSPYDMRVSAGVEVKEDHPSPEMPFDGQPDSLVRPGWQSVRIRRRYSWQPPHGEHH